MKYCEIEKSDCEFIAKFCNCNLVMVKKLYNDNFEPYMLEMVLENSNRERFICKFFEDKLLVTGNSKNLNHALETLIKRALTKIEQAIQTNL